VLMQTVGVGVSLRLDIVLVGERKVLDRHGCCVDCREIFVVDFRSKKTKEGVELRGGGLSSKTVVNLCVWWEAWSPYLDLGVMTGFSFYRLSRRRSPWRNKKRED